MAYFSQEQKAKATPALKALCKKYGITASLAVRNHSVFVMNIKSGSIDFIQNFNETVAKDHYLSARGFTPAKDSLSPNPYHFRDHFTGEAKEFLEAVFRLMDDGNHDNSDIQSDYFDVGWYTDVNIGSWNKPYSLV